jgi:DUF1707 SHOCT-like domain
LTSNHSISKIGVVTDRPTQDLRVGDREREQAADRLSKHAAAGRLSFEELDARLERAQKAVFARDLATLEADLPGPVRRRPARWTAPPLVAFAVLVLGIWLSVLVGHPIAPLFVLAVLLWRPWRAGVQLRSR